MYEIWTLKNYQQIERDPKVGTFVAIGGHGQTNWLEVGPREIAWIKTIGDNAKLWDRVNQKADGEIYIKVNPLVSKWVIVLMGSAGDPRKGYPPQQIEVLEYNVNKTLFRARGIPNLADYSNLNPETEPYLFGAAYSIYPNGTNGLTYGGLLFQMPIFDPLGGFKTSKGVFGLWYPVNFLGERLR